MNSEIKKHHSVMYTQHFGVISRGNSYSVELEHNINAIKKCLKLISSLHVSVRID